MISTAGPETQIEISPSDALFSLKKAQSVAPSLLTTVPSAHREQHIIESGSKSVVESDTLGRGDQGNSELKLSQ